MDILRDRFGVPHCFAATEDEAFRAQGFVHAADRLWQLEYDRRRALGRMAEAVGAAAVVADTFYRRVDLASSCRRDLGQLAPATVAMLESYAAGVNEWVAAADALPREFAVAGIDVFAPWEPWHSLLVYRVRHLLMGSARSKLWRSVVASVAGADAARTVVAGHGEEHVASVPPGERCRPPLVGVGLGEVDGGSNNWVVAGTRTASGLPLLAGDPHRELEAPNVYVQGHLACDEWDVLGIGMPGVPGFPHFGHNDKVAWSITHAMADDQDLYRYAPGSFEGRTETIAVRDGDPVEIDVVTTPRGPLIDVELALTWTATADVNLGFDAVHSMLRSSSAGELFDSMRSWVEPANSLVAADVDGNIGYLLRGRLPVRRRMDAVWLPVDGTDDSFGWDGWVAFEDLPRVENPDTGFVFSANNHLPASPSAPYIGLDVAPPWRATRIADTLSSTTAAEVETMEALHRDVVSLPARRLLAGRLADWAPLAGWDGAMAADSTAAGAYSVFRRELLLVVLERSGLGDVLTSAANRVLPGVVPESVLWRVVEQHAAAGDESLLGGWSWDDAFAAARSRAESVWKGETWGELHRTGQRHVLARLDPSLDPTSTVSVGGDLDTVFSTGYTPTAGLGVKAGSVARYCWDVADWDRSGWVVPLGAAGAPPSPHAGDQQQAWAAGRLLPAPYTRAAIEASTLTAGDG